MPTSPPSRVAIVGAGMAGAVAARMLADAGLSVEVFEKSRGLGGRMATRSANFASFDTGAQYFTVRDEAFRRGVEDWVSEGVAARWDGPFVELSLGRTVKGDSGPPRYVGVPAMTAPAKHLLEGLNVRRETCVANARSDARGIVLSDDAGRELGRFDLAILAIPPEQAAELLGPTNGIAGEIRGVEMEPCWSVMLGLAGPLPAEWSGAFVNGSPVRWLARNHTKPGRDAARETLVIHAEGEWSREHFEDSAEAVIDALAAEAWRQIGIEPPTIIHRDARRWKYSNGSAEFAERFVADDARRIIACGDWAAGARVEGAFLSGLAAARAVLA